MGCEIAQIVKLKSGDSGWTVDVDPLWPGFKGHFPGNPLVPAAEMVSWAQEIAQQKKFSSSTIAKARFLSPVRPGENLKIKTAEKYKSLIVSISRDGTLVAEITLSG